jgi:signal peptidase I
MPPVKQRARVLPQIVTIVTAALLVFGSYYLSHWRFKDIKISPANSMPGMQDGARFVSVGDVSRLPTLKHNDKILIALPRSGGEVVARVVALPGQRIRQTLRDYFIDDREEVRDLTTPYQKPQGGSDFDDLVVPLDCVYVLVDDRSKRSANDSRRLGPIPHHLIVGVLSW